MRNWLPKILGLASNAFAVLVGASTNQISGFNFWSVFWFVLAVILMFLSSEAQQASNSESRGKILLKAFVGLIGVMVIGAGSFRLWNRYGDSLSWVLIGVGLVLLFIALKLVLRDEQQITRPQAVQRRSNRSARRALQQLEQGQVTSSTVYSQMKLLMEHLRFQWQSLVVRVFIVFCIINAVAFALVRFSPRQVPFLLLAYTNELNSEESGRNVADIVEGRMPEEVSRSCHGIDIDHLSYPVEGTGKLQIQNAKEEGLRRGASIVVLIKSVPDGNLRRINMRFVPVETQTTLIVDPEGAIIQDKVAGGDEGGGLDAIINEGTARVTYLTAISIAYTQYAAGKWNESARCFDTSEEYSKKVDQDFWQGFKGRDVVNFLHGGALYMKERSRPLQPRESDRRFELALPYWLTATHLNPNFTSANANVGHVYIWGLPDPDRALFYMNKALTCDVADVLCSKPNASIYLDACVANMRVDKELAQKKGVNEFEKGKLSNYYREMAVTHCSKALELSGDDGNIKLSSTWRLTELRGSFVPPAPTSSP